MTAAHVIDAMRKLSPEERLEVLCFLQQYETVAKLTPEQLGELAERLVHATDPKEVADLKRAMMNGFYGMKIDA